MASSLIDPKTPPEVTPSEAEAQAPDPKKKLKRGTLVGRYTILDALGTGGYATVYAAYQLYGFIGITLVDDS